MTTDRVAHFTRPSPTTSPTDPDAPEAKIGAFQDTRDFSLSFCTRDFTHARGQGLVRVPCTQTHSKDHSLKVCMFITAGHLLKAVL